MDPSLMTTIIFRAYDLYLRGSAVFMRDALSDDAAATPGSALLGRGARALTSSQLAPSSASEPPPTTTLLTIHNIHHTTHNTLLPLMHNKFMNQQHSHVHCPQCQQAHTISKR